MAYAKPKPAIPVLAAAYAWGIIRDHPFIDANKRTTFLIATAFCQANGYRFEAPEGEPTVIFAAAAAGEIQEAGLALWFKRHTRKVRQ
jgi:death-on-curing protein